MAEVQPGALRQTAAERFLRVGGERAGQGERGGRLGLERLGPGQGFRQERLVLQEHRADIRGANPGLEAVHQRIIGR